MPRRAAASPRAEAVTPVAFPASAMRFLVLRLGPGEDLRGALEEAFAAQGEQAGFVVSAVGSLSVAALRHAGRDEASVTEKDYELLSLSGTFSVDGPHLHVMLSDREGRVTGGHLLAGSLIRTTAEIVLGLAEGVRFSRPLDAETGYAELLAETL